MENRKRFHQILRQERELRGWSQVDLASMVGTDQKTVQRWESGERLPRSYSRQKLSQVLGKSIKELGLADGMPANTTTPMPVTPTSSQPLTEIPDIQETGIPPTRLPDESISEPSLQEDWGEAPRVGGNIHGRTSEQSTLEKWLVNDSCRVVALLGMGGVGKTTLASSVVEQTRETFPYLFWRSLQNAPSLEHILKSCIRFLSHQQSSTLPDTEDELIELLMVYLRRHRCLIVLDNFESVLQPQQRAGQYQTGYEGYGRFIQRIGDTQHQSCLLLTSRDKPRQIAQKESNLSRIRSFELQGLGHLEGQALLQERGLSGTDTEWEELIRLYSGNPLALQLVAEPIQEVFSGSITKFLADNEIAFGDLNDMLEQQFQRLSRQEKDVLYWLAIGREAVSLDELREDLLQQSQRGALHETLASLRRRSLIESRESASFTLQPVILEYVTTRLVKRFRDEFLQESSGAWTNYALLKSQAKDYVRDSQKRFLLEPVAQHLLDMFGREGLKFRLQEQLVTQRQLYPLQRSYHAGNTLNLLIFLQYDLRGFDFSHLMIQQAYLQNVVLSGVNFTSARFVASVFTNTFGNILSVTFSDDGKLLVAGTATGDIWIYDAINGKQLALCTGHTDGVWDVVFSPDHQLLASSSDDQTVRLWNVGTGKCLTVLRGHSNRVRSVAFHSEGKILVSGSDDHTACLWEIPSGQLLQTLQGHTNRIWAIAIRQVGDILATGSTDQTIRLWDMATGKCLKILAGHTKAIRSLSFHPNGNLLVSGGDDQMVCLWDMEHTSPIRTFLGHSNRVWSVAFSADGEHLASGSEDHTIRLWETHTGRCIRTFHGHTHGIRSITFSAQNLLASGGDDQTMRLWDITTGNCLRTFQGYTSRIWSALFRPDGEQLLSCGEDQFIRVWDLQRAKTIRTVKEHNHNVRCLAYSPDGKSCASGGEDQTVRLWNPETRQLLKTFSGHTDWVRTVAFHPEKPILASGSEDHTVRLWDIHTGLCLHTLRDHTSWIREATFSVDGNILATGGDDMTIRLWNPITGSSLRVLEGHTGHIRSIAFHPENQLLASGSEDQTIRVWNVATGECPLILHEHTGRVRSVAFSPNGQTLASSSEDHTLRIWDITQKKCLAILPIHTTARWLSFHPQGELLVSSGDDGLIRLWHLPTAQCIQTLLSERPYEDMNITNVQGLTDAQKEALYLLGAIEEQ